MASDGFPRVREGFIPGETQPGACVGDSCVRRETREDCVTPGFRRSGAVCFSGKAT